MGGVIAAKSRLVYLKGFFHVSNGNISVPENTILLCMLTVLSVLNNITEVINNRKRFIF